jgi:hypothetical protein
MKTQTAFSLLLALAFLFLSSSCVNDDINASETVATTLDEGDNVVRFADANLLVHINYDADAPSYTVFIPQVSIDTQTVVAGRPSVTASFPTSTGELDLTIDEDNATANEGRQKNRRVEMTIVFE